MGSGISIPSLIKALECCSDPSNACNECAYVDTNCDMLEKDAYRTLDFLINLTGRREYVTTLEKIKNCSMCDPGFTCPYPDEPDGRKLCWRICKETAEAIEAITDVWKIHTRLLPEPKPVPYDSHILTNPMGEYPAWRSCYECQPRHRDDVFDATRYAVYFMPGRTNGKTYTIDDLLVKGDIEKTMQHDNFITTILAHVARATNEAPFTPKSIEVSADHKTVVVIWIDGSKTMVKRSNNDPDDIYMAFTAALAKRIFSTNSRIKSVIKNKVNYHKPKEKGETHETDSES